MKRTVFPGYEDHLGSNIVEQTEEVLAHKQAQGQAIMAYELAPGMTMEDRWIAGPEPGQELMIRVFTPDHEGEVLPFILDIHGGGFVAGNVDIDNARCIALASRVPAIVVSADYRLSGATGFAFPQPLDDCHTAYTYLVEHGEELGGDPKKIGLHGSSAGGTITAGLALYLRDRNEQTPALTVLNCPATRLDLHASQSYHQFYDLRMGPSNKALGAEAAYLGGYNGLTPSYYAFPGYCPDLAGLGPHMVIVAEYDTLRDHGLQYAQDLLRAGVPSELFQAPRVGHCYTAAPHPYTDFTHDLMAWSFKREFGQLDQLKK